MSKKNDADSTPIVIKSKSDDFFGLVSSSVTNLPIKQVILLFIAFIIVTSDIFTSRVMNKIPEATIGANITSRGAVLQGLMLCLVYIVAHVLVVNEVI